VKQED